MLDLVEETLDQMAFLVEMDIVKTLFRPISPGRDDWDCPAVIDQLD